MLAEELVPVIQYSSAKFRKPNAEETVALWKFPLNLVDDPEKCSFCNSNVMLLRQS